MKVTIRFIIVNILLSCIIASAFFVYIKAKESNFWILTLGVFAVAVMTIYNIIWMYKSSAPKKVQCSSKDHIEPLSYNLGNGGVAPIQVDPKIKDSIQIGKNYYNGRGLPRDFTKAFTLLFEGALAGDSEAQMYVGKMFIYGQGIKVNLNNGKIWLEASAFQGNNEAQYLLGKFYSESNETISILKAIYFLTKSAEQGNQKAKLHLNELYRNNTVAQRADLGAVSTDCYYDYENNPFISGICIRANQSKRTYLDRDLAKAYKLLNVSPNADYEDIRQSYLNLMLKFHPDKNKVESEKVLLVREAYDLIREHLRPNEA